MGLLQRRVARMLLTAGQPEQGLMLEAVNSPLGSGYAARFSDPNLQVLCLATIVDAGPNGEGDTYDESYWVRMEYDTNTGSNYLDGVTVGLVQMLNPLTGSVDASLTWFRATCLDELYTGKHHLPTDGSVTVEILRLPSYGAGGLNCRYAFRAISIARLAYVLADAYPVAGDIGGFWLAKCVYAEKIVTYTNDDVFWVELPGSVRADSGLRDPIGNPILTSMYVVPIKPYTIYHDEVTQEFPFESGGTTTEVTVSRQAVGDVYGLMQDPLGTVKVWTYPRDHTVHKIPLGWEPFAEGRFLVGEKLDDTGDIAYLPVGHTGGFKLHGKTENNHPDHADHHHSITIQQNLSAVIDDPLGETTDNATTGITIDVNTTGIEAGYTGGTAVTMTGHADVADGGHDHQMSIFTGNYADVGSAYGTVEDDVGAPFYTDTDYASVSDDGHEHDLPGITIVDEGHDHTINEPLGGAGHAHVFNIDGIPVAVDTVNVTANTGDEICGEGENAVEHTGPFNDSHDTDNSPPFEVIIWIKRVA